MTGGRFILIFLIREGFSVCKGVAGLKFSFDSSLFSIEGNPIEPLPTTGCCCLVVSDNFFTSATCFSGCALRSRLNDNSKVSLPKSRLMRGHKLNKSVAAVFDVFKSRFIMFDFLTPALLIVLLMLLMFLLLTPLDGCNDLDVFKGMEFLLIRLSRLNLGLDICTEIGEYGEYEEEFECCAAVVVIDPGEAYDLKVKFWLKIIFLSAAF